MLTIDTDFNVSKHIPLLRQKEVDAIGRYFSSSASKRITKTEALAIAGANMKLFTIFENDGDPRLDDDVGTEHAKIALGQATAIGQPEGTAIYFALEHLPNGYTNKDVPGIKNYIRQIRSVFTNKYKVGAYSDGVVLRALMTSGLIEFAWLSASRDFPGSRAFCASGKWALAQDPNNFELDWEGLSVDVNEHKNDFGQFTVMVPTKEQFELQNIVFPSRTFMLREVGGTSERPIVIALADTIQTTPYVLDFARNIATAIVDGPANHCAATLSALLVFVGIFPKGMGNGSGDLEPLVVTLDQDLRGRRGWSKIALGEQIYKGDIGVVMAPRNVHHIYLVINATDQLFPIIADNQLAGIHPRAVAGDPSQNFSPTSYFLRAPE